MTKTKRLKLAFHKDTGLPSGTVDSRDIERAYDTTRDTKYYEQYKNFEWKEVPIWYDIMKFIETRPSNVPAPDRMDDWYRYGYGNRPKFYVESIHWDSPYYERWFRMLGPDLRKMLSGKYGSVYVVDGVLAGYWTFTRAGNQVGVRYLGQQDPDSEKLPY